MVRYLKNKNPKAISYLQLKDIFPQNAVDMGMFGEKGVFNWYFRNKEKALYKASDFIGCMSPANVKFVLEHNPEIDAKRVEVAPNSIEAPYPPKGEIGDENGRSPSGGSGAFSFLSLPPRHSVRRRWQR